MDSEALCLQPLPDIGQRADAGDLGVQLADDVVRRAGRDRKAEPGIDDKVRHAGFRRGRHVRKLRRARAAGDHEALDLAVADLGRKDRQRIR